MAWCKYVKDAVEERVKMERFLAKWKNQGISRCYMAWQQYVSEEKRYRYLVKRFVSRMNNGVMFRIFAQWTELVAENKHNRLVIGRFRTRMMNQEVAKSLASWKEFVELRLRMKYLARRIINRCENGQFLSAWIPWIEYTRAMREKEEEEERMMFMTETQKEEEAKRQKLLAKQKKQQEEMEEERKLREEEFEREKEEFAKQMTSMKEAEAERKKELGMKMIQKMMHGCLATTLQGWKEFVKNEKHYRVVMARFAKKLHMRCANSAYMQWCHYVKERKWLRGLLNRLLGGKEVMLMSAAFKSWQSMASAATYDELHGDLDRYAAENDDLKKQLEELQAKFAVLEGSMGEILKSKQDQAMRSAQKMIRLMKGKAMTSCFMAWCKYVKDAVEERVKMERFLAKWKNQGISRCYMAWQQYVSEEKRYRYLVKRFVSRMNNGVMFRIFAQWTELVAENKHNRLVIGRFRTRMMNQEVAKSLASWKEFVELRLRMKYLARRIINRCENGQFLSAWIPWIEYTRAMREKEEEEERMMFMSKAQREEEERLNSHMSEQKAIAEALQKERDETLRKLNALKDAEAERKRQLGMKMIQKMMHGCLSTTLQGWKEFVKTEKYNRVVMKRFAKKLQMRCVNSALQSWIGFAKERKWLRGLLNRLLGGREMLMKGAGFKAWVVNTQGSALRDRHASEMDLMKAQLEEAKRLHQSHIMTAQEEKAAMNEKLLKKTIYTLQNASLGRCFQTWNQYVIRRGHMKKLVNKVFARVLQRDLSAGLNQWKYYMKQIASEAEITRLKIMKKNKSISMLADRANLIQIRKGEKKRAFVRWMLATYTVSLSGRAVKRLDNFMLMFAHAFSSAHDTSTLISVACECLQSMISGSSGTLMILDKDNNEIWTVKNGAERRTPIHQGILGHVGKTSQSVYTDMFTDDRYNPSVDDITLSRGESSSTAAKTWWGSHMPQIHSSGGSPVLLCIPVRDFEGVTTAVLCAVRSHVEDGRNVKPFNPNDALALAVLSCYVGGHLEKLNGNVGGRDLQPTTDEVRRAMPDVSVGPSTPKGQQPMQTERTNLNSLVKKMELKANHMEKQASNLQYSTKNLEKRLMAMSSYANELEGKMGSSSNIDSQASTPTVVTSGREVDRFRRAASDITGGGSSPGHKSWQQHTQALQRLFEADQGLK